MTSISSLSATSTNFPAATPPATPTNKPTPIDPNTTTPDAIDPNATPASTYTALANASTSTILGTNVNIQA